MLLFKTTLFVEIPRTGTDTIRRSLEGQYTLPEGIDRHVTLAAYLKKYPQANKYTKVSFIRNPFDRVCSLYEHTKHFHPYEPETVSFGSFVNWYVSKNGRKFTRDELRIPEYNMLLNNMGFLGIDWVGRFEEYEESFTALINLLDINFTESIPVTNKFKTMNYRDYYTAKTKKLVADHTHLTLKTWNYTF